MVLYVWERLILYVDGSAHALLFNVKQRGIHQVSIYGAGNIGQHLYQLLESSGIKVIAMFDKNAEAMSFANSPLPVQLPNALDSTLHPCLVIASLAYVDEIQDELTQLGKTDIQLITLC